MEDIWVKKLLAGWEPLDQEDSQAMANSPSTPRTRGILMPLSPQLEAWGKLLSLRGRTRSLRRPESLSSPTVDYVISQPVSQVAPKSSFSRCCLHPQNKTDSSWHWCPCPSELKAALPSPAMMESITVVSLESGIKCVMKFTDDTNLGGVEAPAPRRKPTICGGKVEIQTSDHPVSVLKTMPVSKAYRC